MIGRRTLSRVRELLTGARLERELKDEIRLHLDLLAEDYERRGCSREEARRAARLAFGGVDQTIEAVGDRRGFRPIETLRRDVGLAWRSLSRTPAFTAAAALTLALGIGVNLGIFAMADTVLLRPLPYPHSERLIALWETVASTSTLGRLGGVGAVTPPAARERIAVAPANLADYQARATDLVTFAAYMPTDRNVIGDGGPERLHGEAVTADYFAVLGVLPTIGRPFRADELTPGSDAVVIVNDGFWRRQLGGSPDPIGRSFELDGRPVQVVGVMPPSFEGASHPEQAVEFWVPAALPPDMLTGRGEHVMQAIGRLRPAATVEALRDRLADVPAAIAASDSRAGNLGVGVGALRADQVEATRPLFVTLLAAVAIILATACANVAGLSVVRSMSRGREVAVRMALGASRARLLVAFGAESAVLAALGTFAGLALGYWTMAALVATAPSGIPHLEHISFGGRTYTFAALLAAATTVLVGVLPAWLGSRSDPSTALQSGGRGVVGAWLPRVRSALLAAEIALTLVLLIGAVLMSRSLVSLNRVDLGFDPHDVLATRVALAADRYGDASGRLAFFEQADSRLRTIPGVREVTFANRLPLRGNWASGFTLEGRIAPDRDAVAGFQAVSPGYLATFRIPLRRGRWLASTDRVDTPQVAVVNEAFGRNLLKGQDPIGARFRRSESVPWVTIVGIVGDVRRGGRTARVEPQVYVPAAQTGQYPLWLADIAVRTDGDPGRVQAAVRDAIWSVDARVPVTLVRTLDETLALGQAEREFQTGLFLLFAGLAVALAVIGAYGVAAFAVSQRTSEIGLRMALGAGAGRVLAWVVRQAAGPVVAGTLVGLAAAWFLSRYLSSLLFAIPPTDPASYAGAAILLVLVATAAGLAAGRRAVRIDPTSVLK